MGERISPVVISFHMGLKVSVHKLTTEKWKKLGVYVEILLKLTIQVNFCENSVFMI